MTRRPPRRRVGQLDEAGLVRGPLGHAEDAAQALAPQLRRRVDPHLQAPLPRHGLDAIGQPGRHERAAGLVDEVTGEGDGPGHGDAAGHGVLGRLVGARRERDRGELRLLGLRAVLVEPVGAEHPALGDGLGGGGGLDPVGGQVAQGHRDLGVAGGPAPGGARRGTQPVGVDVGGVAQPHHEDVGALPRRRGQQRRPVGAGEARGLGEGGAHPGGGEVVVEPVGPGAGHDQVGPGRHLAGGRRGHGARGHGVGSFEMGRALSA